MGDQDRWYTYKCPECKKEFTYDLPAEPLCDGPGEQKEHEPEVMRRILVSDKDLGTKHVSEAEGEARAKGILLTPENIIQQKLKVKGKLWRPKDNINPWTNEEMEPDE